MIPEFVEEIYLVYIKNLLIIKQDFDYHYFSTAKFNKTTI